MLPRRVDDQLELRLLREQDAEAMYALIANNRDHLDPWMRWTGFLQSVEDTRAYIRRYGERYAAGTGFHAGMWLDDVLIGGFACRDIDRDSKHCEIGYWLAPEYTGQGIVTRAARAVIDDLFAREKMHRIEIRAADDNLKSRAVAERLGFTFEGILRESEWITTSFRDHAVYSLLDREWPPAT